MTHTPTSTAKTHVCAQPLIVCHQSHIGSCDEVDVNVALRQVC